MGRPMLNHPFPLGRALYWQLKDRVVANAFPHTLHSFSRHRRRLHRLPMKRRRDICEGTDLQGHTATHPCVSKKRRHNRQEGSRAFATPFFGWLPDELVLDILAALDSPRSLISWGKPRAAITSWPTIHSCGTDCVCHALGLSCTTNSLHRASLGVGFIEPRPTRPQARASTLARSL